MALWYLRFGLVSMALVLAASASAQEARHLALVGGRLIDGYGGTPVENSVVLVRGERIEAVADTARSPSRATPR